MSTKHRLREVTDKDYQRWLMLDRTPCKLTPRVNPILKSIHSSINRKNSVKILDCHGMYIHEAYLRTKEFINYHFDIKSKTVIIITGRSGTINEEFPSWFKHSSLIKKIELLENKGSWKVWLKKK